MGGKSVAASREVLNHYFRTATAAKRANVYVALFSGDPDAGGAELPIGTGGYARASVAVADASWTAPSTSGADEIISNANAISFGTASAQWNGGNPITHLAIYDAATAGNLLYSGALGVTRVVNSGDPVTVAAGAITVRES